MNTARTNKLRPPIHSTNTAPRACEHFNKLTLTNLTIYLMKKKLIQLTKIQLANTFQRTHYVCKLGLACINTILQTVYCLFLWGWHDGVFDIVRVFR
jgi:hypothetical protein